MYKLVLHFGDTVKEFDYNSLRSLVFDLNNNRKLEFIFCDYIDIIKYYYDYVTDSYVQLEVY